MTELKQIYKCDICGNMVEIVHASDGQLVCCGQPMTAQVKSKVEASKENNIPASDEFENNKKIYTGHDDEEVLNCEGEPCSFEYNDRTI